jgi:hypothetical protein
MQEKGQSQGYYSPLRGSLYHGINRYKVIVIQQVCQRCEKLRPEFSRDTPAFNPDSTKMEKLNHENTISSARTNNVCSEEYASSLAHLYLTALPTENGLT